MNSSFFMHDSTVVFGLKIRMTFCYVSRGAMGVVYALLPVISHSDDFAKEASFLSASISSKST